MSKIDKLTDAQKARFPEFVRKWTDIGLSTAPTDRPAAEAAIGEMYRAAGLKPPHKIVWCGSPLSQGLTRAIILDQKLIDDIGASVRASVGASVGASVYGQHDAGWLAFYDYFRDAVGLSEQTAKLAGLWALCRSAGWALPHANICWVSERHNILTRDERGRLHNLAGPACAYPDGWAIYAVHGVRVPSDIIEQPASITVKRIEDERNAEVRRVMVERYGQARYLQDSGAKLVSEDRYGKLWRKEQASDEPLVMVEVINSTPEPDGSHKTYWLRVPPDMPTAQAAVAWTFGKSAEEYAPRVET